MFKFDATFCRFEIIVTFTGSSASTGQTTEERTSYLSNEIAWGHRFVNMTEYDSRTQEYFIDYDKFETTEVVSLNSITHCVPVEL